MPQNVVFSNAYIIAFMRDTIEVATLINGKLVKVSLVCTLTCKRVTHSPEQTFNFPGLRCFTQQGGVFFGSQLPMGTTSLYCLSAERLSGDSDGLVTKVSLFSSTHNLAWCVAFFLGDVSISALPTVLVAPMQFSRRLSSRMLVNSTN